MALCDFCQSTGIWDYLSGEGSVKLQGTVKCTMAQLLEFADCPFQKLVISILGDAFLSLSLTRPLLWARGLEFVLRANLRNNGRSISVREQGSHEIEGSIHPKDFQDVFPIKSVPDRFRNFLDRCEQNHSDCSKPIDLGSLAENLDIILIDVNQNCLVKARPTSRYLALSYVWGNTNPWKTLKKNFEMRQSPGFFARNKHQVSETVQDAMEFVRSIGETYLWADVFCIIQDDEDFKSRQIAAMDIIYSCGLATICAVAGVDADSILPGVRPGTLELQYVAVTEELVLAAVRGGPSLQEKLDHSVYEGRGWTFQERNLSRRCVYFTDWDVYFTCQTERLSSIGAVPSVLGDTLITPIHFLGDTISFRNSEPQKQQQVFLHVYSNLVNNYKMRSFTDPSDVIKAFTGVTNRLQSYLDWKFVCGIPIKFLEFSLLWISYTEERFWLPVTRRYDRFPSWSWAGSENIVNYDLASGLLEFCYHCGYQFVPQLLSCEVRDLAADRVSASREGEKWALEFETAVLAAELFDCVDSDLYQGWWRSSIRRNCKTCGILYDHQVPTDAGRAGRLEYILIARMIAPVVDDPEDPPSQNLFLPALPSEFFGGDHLAIVMLIRWDGDNAVREGVGIILEDIWLAANPKKKIIRMA